MKNLYFSLALALLVPGRLIASVVFSEAFSYPKGPIVGAQDSPWLNHSGATNQADLDSGRLCLSQTESEDISVLLPGSPFMTNSATVLYVRLSLQFSGLPAGGGTYFAHFKDAGSRFSARLFASTNNAAAGRFRLGIANGTSGTAISGQLPTDLSLNTAYVVVIRYEVASGASTLWLNPVLETDLSVVATDAPSPNSVQAFAFRQSLSSGSGMGELWVDDLRIGTQFADVVSRPLALSGAMRPADGAFVLILAGEAGEAGDTCTIEASTDLFTWESLGTLTNVTGWESFADTAAPQSTQRFYRATK